MPMKTLTATGAAMALLAAPAFADDRPYDLEVIASDSNGVLYYVHDDGDGQSAAIWTDGETTKKARFYTGRMATSMYEHALGDANIQPVGDDELKMKLFGISIYANDTGDNENARVEINRRGDRKVVVNASDDGPNGDSAHILITDSDDEGTADFIDDIENAPEKMKRDMKAYFGL